MSQLTSKEFEKVLIYCFASHNFQQPLVKAILNRSVEHVRNTVFNKDFSYKNIIIKNNPNYKDIPKAVNALTLVEKNTLVDLINALIDGKIDYSSTLQVFIINCKKIERSVISDIIARFTNRTLTFDAFCFELYTKGLPNRPIRSNIFSLGTAKRNIVNFNANKPSSNEKAVDFLQEHAVKSNDLLSKVITSKDEERFTQITYIKDEKTGKVYQPTAFDANAEEPTAVVLNGMKGVFLNGVFHKEVIQ